PCEDFVSAKVKFLDLAARQKVGLILGAGMLADEPFEKKRHLRGILFCFCLPTLAHGQHLGGGHELAANEKAAQVLDFVFHKRQSPRGPARRTSALACAS